MIFFRTGLVTRNPLQALRYRLPAFYKAASVRPDQGFTLAELLISLMIIAEIATFTIPKVLVSQQNVQFNAIGKETAGMIAQAYYQYQLQAAPSASTSVNNLTPFMNYVKVSTTLTVDDQQGATSDVCRNAYPCLVLHNGATLLYEDGQTFNGTATTNALWFHVDPDGKYSGTTTGAGKAVGFFIYFNGRITTEGTILPNTKNSGGTYTPDPTSDPPWFSWN